MYTDLIPRDFARPCNMVGLARIAMDPLACGLSGVELLYQYKITTFSTVDEVHHSHLPLLDLRAMAVMGACPLLADSSLAVSSLPRAVRSSLTSHSGWE